jgi:hypothetical protein
MQSADVMHKSIDAMGGEILSVCANASEVHPEAKYWLPLANAARFDAFVKMNKIQLITTPEQFAKLLAGRIVVKI